MTDIRIQDSHDIQRLYDIRTIMARQTNICLKMQRLRDLFDTVLNRLFDLWRPATNLQ